MDRRVIILGYAVSVQPGVHIGVYSTRGLVFVGSGRGLRPRNFGVPKMGKGPSIRLRGVSLVSGIFSEIPI